MEPRRCQRRPKTSAPSHSRCPADAPIRNLEDHAAVRAALRKAGVQLHSVTETLEDSASGKLVEGILASIAEFYSANLGQEIRKGMDQKAAQGGWPVRAPFGYQNVRRDG
ncbi:MAG: recombinase family protein, partial [Candidatus Limnocylindria bacterium]